MAEDIQKIQHIVNQYSLLTKREEIDLVTVLHQSRSRHIRQLRTLFEEDPRWIEKFYNIYKAKRRAVIDQDKDAWDEVLRQEVTEFGGYSFFD